MRRARTACSLGGGVGDIRERGLGSGDYALLGRWGVRADLVFVHSRQ